jgi:hypothetical protein
MTDADLKRKLRDLRQTERRIRRGDATPTFDEFFALNPAHVVRYPFGVLRVLDRDSRRRAIREYMSALFGDRIRSGAMDQLLQALGLPANADDDRVVREFRRLAVQIHPDTGGDEELMKELLSLYGEWRSHGRKDWIGDGKQS